MWKIFYNGTKGGQNPYFWSRKLQDLDVGIAKEMGKEDYMTEVFLKYLPKKGRILDGGCGIGQHVLAYRDLGYRVEGIDFSEETIEKITSFDAGAPCKKGNILKIEEADSSFDCYYSLGVIEHFEEGPFEVIREAQRILKDKGIFIVNVPYENFFRKVKFNILDIIRKTTGKDYINTGIGFGKKIKNFIKTENKDYGMEFHEYVCNKREILSYLQANGFKVLYSSPCSIIWGILELPLMNKIYGFAYNFLKRKEINTKSEKTEKARKRSFLKDVLIYEKKSGYAKNLLVNLFGYMFGNLLLVICRKEKVESTEKNTLPA